MASNPFIPLSLSEVTAEYLTDALRSAGVLPSGSVTQFQSRVIGEGAGFMGDVVDLSVTYSDGIDGPRRFVLKIPTATKNREIGQTLGVYEREIRFYRELQPQMKVRTPRHYFSAMDTTLDPETGLKALRVVHGLPIWLIRLLLPLLNWINGKSEWHFVLLIEHLRDYRIGDQVRGCSIDESRRVLKSMATMHAQFRDSEALETFPWLVPYRYATKPLHMMYLRATEPFKDRYRHVLTPNAVYLIDWLRDNFFALWEALEERPLTLVHGDFRLDNLCFDDQRGEVILFDWQTLGVGSGAIDLAYFLSAAVTEDASEGTIDGLLEDYRIEMAAHGVDIAPEVLRWEYDLGLLAMLHRLVPAEFQDMLDLGDGRGTELLATWMARIMVHVENIDPDRLLASRPGSQDTLT